MPIIHILADHEVRHVRGVMSGDAPSPMGYDLLYMMSLSSAVPEHLLHAPELHGHLGALERQVDVDPVYGEGRSHETEVHHPVDLLGHVRVPADVVVDVGLDAGAVVQKIQEHGHHVLVVQPVYGSSLHCSPPIHGRWDWI